MIKLVVPTDVLMVSFWTMVLKVACEIIPGNNVPIAEDVDVGCLANMY